MRKKPESLTAAEKKELLLITKILNRQPTDMEFKAYRGYLQERGWTVAEAAQSEFECDYMRLWFSLHWSR